MPTLDGIVRTLRRGSDRTAALAADREREEEGEARHRAAVVDTLAPYTRHAEGLVFGHTPGLDGSSLTVTLPYRVAHERSAWITGATGAGKTTFLLAITLQDLTTPDRAVIACDFQGSEGGYANRLRHHVIPGLVARFDTAEADGFLGAMRVVAPWRSTTLPSLNLTNAAGPVQRRAAELVDVFAATTGGDFGPRMLSCTLPLVRLAMVARVPLPLLPEIATNAATRRALLLAAEDPELHSYFRDRFAADFRDAGASVLSRIDRLLMDEPTRAAMFAPHPFDPSSWLEGGTTVIDLGGATPLLRDFWAALFQSTLLAAVLSRRTTRVSPRVILRIDEAQLGVPSAAQAAALDDALSRMRSRRAALTVAHQHCAQLAGHANLLQSLKANAGVIATFRVPQETAAATGVMPDALLPGMDADVTEAQMRDAWTRVIASLPDRHFILRAPALSAASIPVRAPTFDAEQFGSGASAELRARVQEAGGGLTRAALRAHETSWRSLLAEVAQAAEPNVDTLHDVVDDLTSAQPARTGRRPRQRATPEVG